MATLKDLRSDLRSRLATAAEGNKPLVNLLDWELDFWLNDAQRRLAMALPLSIKQRFATSKDIGWSDGVEFYDLPDDLLDIIAVIDHEGNTIKPTPLEQMAALRKNTLWEPTADERAYYRKGAQIGVRPVPAA